jgi:TorA maturation chaperone TorD
MELFRALGSLIETPRPELAEIAELLDLGPLPTRAAHGSLFLQQLYPYASVYLGAEGQMGGEARDRIAGFWRALGQTPPADPDHLTLMLGLHARLAELEEQAGEGSAHQPWRHARGAFLWEHLLSWLPIFLMKLLDLAAADEVADPFYASWAVLLRDALREEAKSLLPPDHAAKLPLHLREAPGLVDPRGGAAQDFLGALLSPVRSGMILVRADLARAARELGLGPRLGERRSMLATLLEQDAAAALGWLGNEAAAWAGRHQPDTHFAPQLALFWRHHAEAAARLLGELRAEA